MLRFRSLLSALTAGGLALAPAVALADWPTNPLANLPICTMANQQLIPQMTTDMAGGAIITWYDNRVSTDYNIYAMRVLSTGVVDPAWPAQGRLICGATGSQILPCITSDGSGGAIIAWADNRLGTASDLYATHVLSNGSLDPAWPADGQLISAAAGQQTLPRIVGDGANGALIAWRDTRNDTDYYAMRVLPSGQLDPAWTPNGVGICVAPGGQLNGEIVTDGQGGLIASWHDFRSGATADIYAQRLLRNGQIAPGWPANGGALCAAAETQQFAQIAADGSGGAIVTWEDMRSVTTADVYAQRIRGNGTMAPGWPADGLAISTGVGNQNRPVIVSDGSGGAIILFRDTRAGSVPNLYAQHALATGSLDATWPGGDLLVCQASGDQYNLTMVSDGAHGAIPLWEDARGGTSAADLFAHHILAAGVVDPVWPADGRGFSTAPMIQNAPRAIPDGSGGFIAAWMDQRPGSGVNDIYAQRVKADGTLGGSVVGVPQGKPFGFAIHPPTPNPWRGGPLTVRYALGDRRGATLELMDLAGRLRAIRALDQGEGEARFEATSIKPGVYFVVLRDRDGGQTRSVRVVALK